MSRTRAQSRAADTSSRLHPESLELECLFRPLENANGIILAVSGGSDSIALMHLVAWWCGRAPRPPVAVASVDHGLRVEAGPEAEAVVATAVRLGFPGQVLRWTGDKPQRAVQDQARQARYGLLADFARSRDASHVVTAHTLDDQAETVLLRLAAGSGMSGLGGMRRSTPRDGLLLVRPLLELTKATLRDLCRDNGWCTLEDPANTDPRFARARLRALAPGLDREGLTAERLGRLAARLSRADDALERATEAAHSASALPDGTRYAMARLAAEPEEIVIRVVATALAALSVGGRMRLEKLETLVAALLDHHRRGAGLRRTLKGCIVTLDRTGMLGFAPEGPRTPSRTRREDKIAYLDPMSQP